MLVGDAVGVGERAISLMKRAGAGTSATIYGIGTAILHVCEKRMIRMAMMFEITVCTVGAGGVKKSIANGHFVVRLSG